MADVIPLHPVKIVSPVDARGRWAALERTPPKGRELRLSLPVSRMAGREQDALAGMGTLKLPARLRKNTKLRFFRIFKLFTEVKRQAPTEASFRPMAEKLRRMRWLRRL